MEGFFHISLGVKNQYNHPAVNVLNRVKTAKSTVYRTDQKVSIVVTKALKQNNDLI